MPGYEKDLAYVHHAGFGGFARDAAPALLGILRRADIARGLVVDLGCGSGIWAGELLAAGYRVLGVDLSAAMVRLARKNAPGARFRVASLLDFELPPCDAVTAIGESVNYAFDPRNSRKEMARLFRRVYAALRPGGVFVFDVAEPGRLPAPGWRRQFFEGPDWAVLVEAVEDGRRLTRRIVTFRRVGKLYRRSQEFHTLRLYRRSELGAELERVGFRVRFLRGYGPARLPGAHVAIVARKPLTSGPPARATGIRTAARRGR